MTGDRQLTFFCDPARHAGKKKPAAWLVRSWESEEQFNAQRYADVRSWSACEHCLRHAINVVTAACESTRPFLVLRNVKGM